jgi:hypothetical protein
MFATKPDLAGELLKQAHDPGISASFVAGDDVYGPFDLRRSIRELGFGYVMAVRSNHMVTLPSGRRLTVKTARNLVKPSMWQRMRTGSATKGAKDYHWAMIETTPDDTPGGHHDGHAFLLLRRHRCTGTISYYLCWSQQPVPLAKLIEVAVARWKIEEDHQMSKQVTGLDSGHVTTWTCWHRWTAISLLAAAFLAVAAAWQRARDGSTPALELIPGHHSRAAQTAPRHRHPLAPPRQGPPRRMDPLETPPSISCPPRPPALARLRGRGATTVTNYNCRSLAPLDPLRIGRRSPRGCYGSLTRLGVCFPSQGCHGTLQCDTGVMSEQSASAGGTVWDALLRASAEDKLFWQNMWLEEYRSIRGESEQARNAQQTILQWSLAAFAAVIAGALVTFSGNVNIRSGETGTVLLIIFGMGLPFLSFFSYLVWWGEFLRMERAGRYIRGLEFMADRLANSTSGKLPPPLQWEHFLAGPSYSVALRRREAARHKRLGRAKYIVGYLGAAGIYFGFSFSSLVIFVSLVIDHKFGHRTAIIQGLSCAWFVIFLSLFVVIGLYQKREADRQSRQRILIPDALPWLDFMSQTGAVCSSDLSDLGDRLNTSTTPILDLEQSHSSPQALPQEGT